ncbi:HEAT repeat domain-containing protein [Elusimicrobiota bacterium]
MNFRAIAALLAIFIPFAAHAQSNVTLEQILNKLNLDPKDLNLRHDLIDNPFKLERAVSLLEDPHEALAKSHEQAVRIRGLDSPSEILKLQLDYLGLSANQGSQEKTQALKSIELPKIAPLFDKELESLTKSVMTAKSRLDKALGNITKAKQSELVEFVLPHITAGMPKLETLDSPNETWWERDSARLEEIKKLDIEAVLNAAAELSKTIEASLDDLIKAADSIPKTFKTKRIRSALGDIVIGAKGDDRHLRRANIIIDTGGNDEYAYEEARDPYGEVLLIIDLSGNDHYSNANQAQGSAIFGISIHIDVKGNDRYQAKDISQGAGVFGAGILWDKAGNDRYTGEFFTQGAGIWGAGLLLDDDGRDNYNGGYFAQGVGLPGGTGMILDKKGNDDYSAGGLRPDPRGWQENYGGFSQGEVSQSMSQGFSLGWRNFAAGGIGILADIQGNDIYSIDYFGQGAGYWLGWGMLYDGQGNDRYLSRRYAQGSGVHFAVGTLLDETGNDNYLGWAVSQGCGHDYALGLLWDGLGNDTYTMDPTASHQQGAANASAIGMLIDQGGNDSYAANLTNGLGYNTWDEKRQSNGIGIVIDASSKRDQMPKIIDQKPWQRMETHNAIALWEENGFESGIEIIKQEIDTPQFYHEQVSKDSAYLANRLDQTRTLKGRTLLSELLAISSWWGFGGRTSMQAKDMLWQITAKENLPAILTMLNPHSVIAIFNLEEIFAWLGPDAETALINNLKSENEKDRARSLYFLAQVRSTRNLESIQKALKDPSWKVKRHAARALARIMDDRHIGYLKKLRKHLSSSDHEKTKQSFESLKKTDMLLMLQGTNMPKDLKYNYLNGFVVDSPKQDQRIKAMEWFDKNKKTTIGWLDKRITSLENTKTLTGPLIEAVKDPDRDVRKWAVVGLGRVRSRSLCDLAGSLMSDTDYQVRDAAVNALSSLDGSVCKEVKKLSKEAPTQRVKNLAKQVIAKSKKK